MNSTEQYVHSLNYTDAEKTSESLLKDVCNITCMSYSIYYDNK